MPSRAAKSKGKAPLDQRPNTRGWSSGPSPAFASAISSPVPVHSHAQMPAACMDPEEAAPSQGPETHLLQPLAGDGEAGAFTKTLLEAIDDCKAALMVKIDHLVAECTLIRHDLDKIRGRLTSAFLQWRMPPTLMVHSCQSYKTW